MRFFYNEAEMEYEDEVGAGVAGDTETNWVSLSGGTDQLLQMRWSDYLSDDHDDFNLYVTLVKEVDDAGVEMGRIVVSAAWDANDVFALSLEEEEPPWEEEEDQGALCFLGDTKVKTDQGPVAFHNLTTNHSIGGKRIQKVIKVRNSDDSMIFIRKHSLGKGIPNKNTYIGRNHGIYLPDGSFVRARNLITNKGIAEHSRNPDLIYNVLLYTYGKMNVNGMTCETLNINDPDVRRLLNNSN
tara:strand:- start:981 stop:1703 length:723 start_codon:yes stop_codon:yes gene_type:complete